MRAWYGSGRYWYVVAQPYEAGGPAFVGSAFLLSFAVSTLAFIFPSGLGVREGAFALALAQNLPTGVAVALSVGTRVLLTVVELAVIAVLLASGPRYIDVAAGQGKSADRIIRIGHMGWCDAADIEIVLDALAEVMPALVEV